MFLQVKDTGALIELEDIQELINPTSDAVHAQQQAGEDEQETYSYSKENLIFPSGESLPRCWMDANYKADEAA